MIRVRIPADPLSSKILEIYKKINLAYISVDEIKKGALFIIVAMLIFGFMGIFVRFLNLPSFVIVFFNFLFAGLILFFGFLIDKKYLWLLVLFGLFNVANNFFYFQAFIKTTISNAVFTHYTAPIFVALLAPLLIKEKLERITILGLFLSVIGLVFITNINFSFRSEDFSGIMFGLASGVMYALGIISVKYLSKYMNVTSINVYQSFAGSLILMPFVINTNLNLNFNLFLLLLVFAVLFGIIATLLHFAGIKRVKSQ